MFLLDKLYTINTHCPVDDSIWEIIQVKRIGRMFSKVVANGILPFAFMLSKQKKDRIGNDTLPIVVSMTSFPARIGRVWMTIESMIRQKKKPQEIVLWLSRDQFPNENKDLPFELIEQTRRGLTIRFVDGDIRSYKKFYYAFQEYKDCYIVTIDDDLLFPSFFLESMYACKQQHPNDVIASFGFRFSWNEAKRYIDIISNKINPGDSGLDLFYGSGGGTLYDPENLIENLDCWDIIHELCPTADDIYLNALTRISGYGVTFHQNYPLLSIVNNNDSKLVTHNGDIGDVNSINARQMKSLLGHFGSKGLKNPFNVTV